MLLPACIGYVHVLPGITLDSHEQQYSIREPVLHLKMKKVCDNKLVQFVGMDT